MTDDPREYAGRPNRALRTTVVWATECPECGDGLRYHLNEQSARASYKEDVAFEVAFSIPDTERHHLRLLRVETAQTTTVVASASSDYGPGYGKEI